MPKKIDLPARAPKFWEGEWIAGIVTVILCAISALALSYHVFEAAPQDLPEPILWAFTGLCGLFAFGMGLVPMMLARAHGTALEGCNAQTAITLVVFLFIIVDMALQVHAMHYVMTLMEMKVPHVGWLIGISAAFQIAAFMVRGALYAATREIQDLIDAREHDRQMAEAYAKEAYNAKRRERYAEQKESNVVNMR